MLFLVSRTRNDDNEYSMQGKMIRRMGLRIFALRDESHNLCPQRTYIRVRRFSTKEQEAVREDKLDFITASKMLFSTPTKSKKFGFDFHLVQFFFACLPPLAVYLVAQYARYDMRKMEAEMQKKKHQTSIREKSNHSSSALDSTSSLEEDNLKSKMDSPPEISSKQREASSERAGKHVTSDTELQQMKCRLDALEVAIKEIAAGEAKKSSIEVVAQVKGAKEQEKQAIPAVTTESKENVNEPVRSVKGGSEDKEGSSNDNANAKNVVLGPKQKSIAGGNSHETNADANLLSKNARPGLEANK